MRSNQFEDEAFKLINTLKNKFIKTHLGNLMKTLPIVLSGLFLLTACSSNKLATTGVEDLATQQALKSDMTPGQAVADARKSMDKAVQDNLAFYTPLHFKNAQESLSYIEQLQNGEASEDGMSTELAIITTAFKTKEFLNGGYKAKALIEQVLADSLAHKNILDELDSKKEYPKTYGKTINELTDLFKLIEQNDVEKARKEEAELLADMTSLEINTLIKRHVTPAQLVLDKAEDNDADDYAEKTFEQAEKSIEQAIAFINKNYRQRKQVSQAGKDALTAAQRALHIGQASQSMVKLNEEEAEQKALEVESLIKVIRTAMKVEGIEGLAVKEQAAELAALASAGYTSPVAVDDMQTETENAEQPGVTDSSSDSVLTPLDTSFLKPFEAQEAAVEDDVDSDVESEVENKANSEASSESTDDASEPQTEEAL